MYRIHRFLSILLFALLLFATPRISTAQQDTPNSNKAGGAVATASANIVIGLTLEGVQQLLLEDIVAGEEKTVFVDGRVEGSQVTGNEQPGKFRVNTMGSVMLEFSEIPSYMIGPGGARMPVRFHTAWSGSVVPPAGGRDVVELGEGLSSIFVDSTGDIFVFLGATVTPPETQAEGVYQSRVVLTATYGID